MLLASVMRPLPTPGDWSCSEATQRIADAPLSIVRGPPASYVAEWLAGAIQSHQRWQNCVWLRGQWRRPDALAASLTNACHYRWSTADRPESSEGYSGQPRDGPMHAAPPGAVIVLEFRGRMPPGFSPLIAKLRGAACDSGVSLIAVTQSRLPPLSGPRGDHVVAAADLGDPAGGGRLDGLPGRYRAKLLRLVGGRAAVMHDVLDAARVWPSDAVLDAIRAARSRAGLAARLTANLLQMCGPAQREALEMCVATGYWHPRFLTSTATADSLRPWVVPLERDWGWLRPVWARPVARGLAGDGGRGRPRHTAVAGGPTAVPLSGGTRTGIGRGAQRRGLLEARLLGSFEIRLNGREITRWTGQRGTSVLRLLLYRPRRACPRDELLAEFWPDVPPAVARNRLQVAISGLRRILQEVTDLNVIEYADGGYRINPALLVTVDVERFQQSLSAARGSERAGAVDRALNGYGAAIELYRGDFAADAPYEQWTMLPRESLRIAYLDALDRVSRIQLRLGRLDECIGTGIRMLALDPCREDAHRLLMRCYARQGHVYQALHQFDSCCRVLAATLQTGPAPQTIKLYQAIKRGSVAEPR